MKTIGILGGLGPESTVSYYTQITRNYYEEHRNYSYPNIVIYSMTFDPIIKLGYDAPDEVLAALTSLHRAGADFVVAACNSIHLVYERVAPKSPVPWVSIMDATGEKIKADGLRRVALLGTRFTMGNGFYQRSLKAYGIEAITPDATTQNVVNDIIFQELVLGKVVPESKKKVLKIMNELHKQGAQGTILGCTELPFLIQQADSKLPVFDTTTIHARKALDLALE